MKKSKLVVLLAVTGLLTACGTTGGSSSSSQTSTPSSSESSSENGTSLTSSTSSTSEGLYVDDPEPTPTYDDETPVVTRAFNPLFDSYLDDFSSSTPKGTVEGDAAYLGTPYLQVNIDNTGEEKTGNTPDAAVYKYATGTYALQEYQIAFKLKLIAGSLNLHDLKLGLRGDDSYEVYSLPFDEVYDGDLEPMAELSTEYQEYVIDLNNTISDDSVEYKLFSDGSDSGVRVLEKVLGLHLFVGDDVKAKLGVAEVAIYKAGVKTVLDDFARVDVSKADANCWWRGSVGSIVQRNVKLVDGGTYSVSDADALSGYNNLALSMKGDFRSLLIYPILSGEQGNPISWSEAQDPDGNALFLTSHTYKTAVLNFANSGIEGDVTGFVFISTSQMWVNSLFATNLESKTAELQYPYVDLANAQVFDRFDGRIQASLNDDYEASSTNPDIIAANLYYSLSYNNGSMVSVKDGVLTFDATSLPSAGYIQAKEASSVVNGAHYQYMVIALKGEEGADLSGFRIMGTGSNAVYANDWYSGFGLKTPALDVTNFPYIDANGFVYMIINLQESGLEVADTLDMYYSGTGKLIINEILFANKVAPFDETKAESIGEGGDVDFSSGGYNYKYLGYNGDQLPYLALTFKGDGTADLASFRIGNNGAISWLKDGALIDPFGNPITDVSLTTESRTIIIDLVASGLSVTDPDLHGHFGDFGDNNGIVTIEAVEALPLASFTRVIDASSHPITYTADGYTYGFGIGDLNNPARYLTLSIVGDGTADLASFRLEFAGATIWSSALVDQSGSPIASIVPSTEGTIVVIDMLASGFDIDAMYGAMHFHFGGSGVGGTITINEVAYMDYSPMSYADLL